MFYAFPIKAYVKHVAPRMGPFWQNGHNFNKPGGGVYYIDDTNTNYQGCMPSGSRQEDLLCVPYINLWKTCESGAGHNWP